MIRIGILGEIGAGKSFVAKNFGYPVFNADLEVSKLYKSNKRIFLKLNKKLPKYILSFPIEKKQITKAILSNNSNFKKILNIVHLEIRKKMNIFLEKNKNKKIIILDIPLLLENKIYKKKDILVFIDSPKKEIIRRLKRRPGRVRVPGQSMAFLEDLAETRSIERSIEARENRERLRRPNK